MVKKNEFQVVPGGLQRVLACLILYKIVFHSIRPQNTNRPILERYGALPAQKNVKIADTYNALRGFGAPR